MLCPKSSDSFGADKIAAVGLSHRFREGRLVIITHRNWEKIVLFRKLQNKSRKRILGLGRQAPDSLDSAFE